MKLLKRKQKQALTPEEQVKESVFNKGANPVDLVDIFDMTVTLCIDETTNRDKEYRGQIKIKASQVPETASYQGAGRSGFMGTGPLKALFRIRASGETEEKTEIIPVTIKTTNYPVTLKDGSTASVSRRRGTTEEINGKQYRFTLK